MYAKALEAVKLRAATSAYSLELIWILSEINPEARLWNYSQSVNVNQVRQIPSSNMIQ
jgi:hypothetical protein